MGVGASRIRDLFKRARVNAPCIVFVDELDAIGLHRSGAGSETNEEREQTLNQVGGRAGGWGRWANALHARTHALCPPPPHTHTHTHTYTPHQCCSCCLR